MLLIIGALISSYIIPLYTRTWQDHQKELELKTQLVSEISDAITTVLIKTQTTKAIISTPYKEFYDAYQSWESASAIIESKLQAFFYNSHIPDLWGNYSIILTDFAFLSISTDMCKRSEYTEEIQKYFDVSSEVMNQTEIDNCASELDRYQKVYVTPFRADIDSIDWNQLVKYGNDTQLSHSWLVLKQNMINQKDKLIQEILKSHIQAFS